MLLRRMAALLVTLFTLHLNLQSVDSACATHPLAGIAHDRDASMSDRDAIMSAEMKVSAPHHGTHKSEPCELPAKSNCCRALVSCGVVFPSNNALTPLHQFASREMIVRNAMLVPSSEIVSPDPPPPKA